MNIRDEVFYEVLKFFNGDGENAEHWMGNQNPLLGGRTPDGVIEKGAGKKLLEHLRDVAQKQEAGK